MSPDSFALRKFALPDGVRVRVASPGAATVYQVPKGSEWLRDFASDLDSGLFGELPKLPPEVAELLPDVQRAIVGSGLAGALGFLNARVPHRFTALYRLDGMVLRNVGVFDKHKHLDALDLRVVPLKDSFCQFVLRDGLFVTQASGSDPRLIGHPYAGAVNCYVGVPVEGPRGLRGTLCHFDTADHTLPDLEYLLLSHVAHMLAPYLDAL